MSLIAKAVRLKFATTSKNAATAQIQDEAQRSIGLAKSVTPEKAAQSVKVPSMLGVDPEMREWSLLQILEHNLIVNRRITETIHILLQGSPREGDDFDPKRDVLPTKHPELSVVDDFSKSIDEHLALVDLQASLKSSLTSEHPIFGPFDPHRWHCMFGFHLQIHRKQMEAAAKKLTSKTRS